MTPRTPENTLTKMRLIKTLICMSEEAYAAVFPEPERSALQQLVEVMGFVPQITPAILDAHPEWVDVEFLVSGWGTPALTARLLGRLPALTVVFHTGGTVKSIVTAPLWKRGIRVTSAAQANARPVAEFACAQIILALKRVWPRALAWREERRYLASDPLAPGAFNSTIGLLGLSRTGRLLRELLRSYDLRVLVNDPTVSAEEAEILGVELAPLTRIFSEASVVSCHLPLLKRTTGLLQARHFAAMRPGATFINTARAGVLRATDLLEVLQARPDLCALLDVTEPEPPAPETLLLELPNVILTPHLAGSQGEECRRMGGMVIEEIRCQLQGQALHGEVKQQHLTVIA